MRAAFHLSTRHNYLLLVITHLFDLREFLYGRAVGQQLSFTDVFVRLCVEPPNVLDTCQQ